MSVRIYTYPLLAQRLPEVCSVSIGTTRTVWLAEKLPTTPVGTAQGQTGNTTTPDRYPIRFRAPGQDAISAPDARAFGASVDP